MPFSNKRNPKTSRKSIYDTSTANPLISCTLTLLYTPPFSKGAITHIPPSQLDKRMCLPQSHLSLTHSINCRLRHFQTSVSLHHILTGNWVKQVNPIIKPIASLPLPSSTFLSILPRAPHFSSSSSLALLPSFPALAASLFLPPSHVS